jgi:hypothetical protein
LVFDASKHLERLAVPDVEEMAKATSATDLPF